MIGANDPVVEPPPPNQIVNIIYRVSAVLVCQVRLFFLRALHRNGQRRPVAVIIDF